MSVGPQNWRCILLRCLLSSNRRNNLLILYCFYSYTFCLPFSFSLLCALLLHSLSRSRCHFFLLHFVLCFFLMFSLVHGVLPCVLFSFFSFILSLSFCNFIHSIFTFSGFGKFRLFAFTDFALIIYKRYVFLSFVLEMLSECLYHRF